MATRILAELDIKATLQGDLPEGVCGHKRVCDGVEYLFVQNYSPNAVEVDVGDGYVDMESKEEVTSISLNAFDVRIFRKRL